MTRRQMGRGPVHREAAARHSFLLAEAKQRPEGQVAAGRCPSLVPACSTHPHPSQQVGHCPPGPSHPVTKQCSREATPAAPHPCSTTSPPGASEGVCVWRVWETGPPVTPNPPPPTQEERPLLEWRWGGGPRPSGLLGGKVRLHASRSNLK